MIVFYALNHDNLISILTHYSSLVLSLIRYPTGLQNIEKHEIGRPRDFRTKTTPSIRKLNLQNEV